MLHTCSIVFHGCLFCFIQNDLILSCAVIEENFNLHLNSGYFWPLVKRPQLIKTTLKTLPSTRVQILASTYTYVKHAHARVTVSFCTVHASHTKRITWQTVCKCTQARRSLKSRLTAGFLRTGKAERPVFLKWPIFIKAKIF